MIDPLYDRVSLGALSLLTALGLAGVVSTTWAAASATMRAPGVRVDARYADLVRLLPGDMTLGYITDIPQDRVDGRFYDVYYQAQYAFAPRLLLDGAGRTRFVIADLESATSLEEIAARDCLVTVHSTRAGTVVLLERCR